MDTKKRGVNLLAKSLLIVFALAFFVAPARAEEVAPADSAVQEKPILISTVNIYNAKIAKYDQEKSELKIFFDIYNREKAQPQIMYAIQLIKEENGKQYLADEKLYDKMISLSENQASSESIIYSVPGYLSGKYKVFVKNINTKGMDLAVAYVGEADLKAKATQYLEMLNNSCYITVEGEKSGAKYTLRQGVDIADNEKLIGHCEIINHYQTAVDFTPSFETHFRALSGEIVADISGDLEKSVLRLEKNEKKLFSFTLPKALKPQAYDAVLILKDTQGENMISNKIAFHYVLHGLSATIQNLRLDKDYYAKGETAKASFFWTPSADNFPGSRLGKTALDSGVLEIEIKNCSKKIIKTVDEQSAFLDLEIPIERNCSNPQAVVIIKNKDGVVLDQNIFDIKSEIISENASQPEASAEKTGGVKKIILAVVLALTFISFAVIFIKKRNAKFLGIFLLVFLAMSAVGIKETKADMVAIGGGDGYQRLSYNIDCSTCLAGEDIISTSSMYWVGCLNHGPGYLVDTFFKANSTDFKEVQLLYKENQYISEDAVFGGTEPLPAPSAAGNYDAIFPTKTYTMYGKLACYACAVMSTCLDKCDPLCTADKVNGTCNVLGDGGTAPCCATYTEYKDYGNSLAIPYTVPETSTGLLTKVEGEGWVSSSPLGIRCGNDDGTIVKDCFSIFHEDIWVTLTAHAGIGVTAINWTGCVEGPRNPLSGIADTCRTKMRKDNIEKVAVDFVGGGHCVLSVDNYSADTAGAGIITNTGTSEACSTGPLCTWEYPLGGSATALVSLTETPNGGSKFGEWGGVCTGSNSTCLFACDEANKMVSAGFYADVQYTLKVNNFSKNGGTGTVEDGGSNSCPADSTCSWKYDAGTPVSLTATPNGASSFEWSDSCAGSGACLITMDGNKTATATFDGTVCTYSNYTCIPISPCVGNICGDDQMGSVICQAKNSCTGNMETRPLGDCVGCVATTEDCNPCPEPSGNWKEVAP